MTAKNEAGNLEAFTGIIGALRAVYESEIQRLAELYRPRILAGEFSGTLDEGRGDPAYIRLEEELRETHPWTHDDSMGRAVLAVSSWAHGADSLVSDGSGVEISLFGELLADEVAESMAHDLLAVAVARGWVRRYQRTAPAYLLKVA